MLSALVLMTASFLFHKHHKPQPAQPAQPVPTETLQKKLKEYAESTFKRVNTVLKDHPELQGGADKVYTDLETLLQDDADKDPAKMLKDLDRVEDDLDILEGEAYLIEHYKIT